MLIATANIVAGGRDVRATTTITHSTTAWVGGTATVTTIKPPAGTMNGDLTVQAIAAVEGDAKAQSYGGSLVVDVTGAASGADTTVTPTVSATVGAGTHLKAAGSAEVIATYHPSGAPPSTQIMHVDTIADTLQVDLGLHLGDGDVITYDPGPLAIQPLQPFTDVPARNYPVIVVSSDAVAHTSLIQLGAAFSASAVDPITDTIHFASAHPFRDGDRVVLGSPLETFDPSAVDDAADSFTLSVPTSLKTGDAVVYPNHAGAPRSPGSRGERRTTSSSTPMAGRFAWRPRGPTRSPHFPWSSRSRRRRRQANSTASKACCPECSPTPRTS